MSDGRLVMTGQAGAITGTPQPGVGMMRFMPNGAPDPSFSGDGKATSPIVAGATVNPWTGTVSPVDGKILIAGALNTVALGLPDFFVARFNNDITTAGEVSVSGRVMTADGRGVTNARITVSGGKLSEPITAVTGRRGSFTIDGLDAGMTYEITVISRRFIFDEPTRILTLNDSATNVNFISSGGR
jgi:hypothetical protein